MSPGEESGQFIDPRSSHCPGKNQQKRQKAKSKPKQQSQANNATPSTQEDLNNLTSLTNTMHTSTPNAQYGGFFHSGMPSIQHTPYSTHFTSSTLSHHSTPIPSSSWSISPYDPPQQGLAFHQTAPTVQKMQHGGLVHSPLYSSGSYLTLSMPSGGSLMSSYGAPQQGVALHQTAPVAPHHQLGNNSTWHSGMSPQKYEVVVLKQA